MKQILLSVLAAGCAAGLAAPAAATPVSTAAVYEAGRCIVQRDYGRAVALLQALPLDDRAADLQALLGSPASSCIGEAEGASAMQVRGAIAQALFLRDFRGFGREPRANARLVDLNLPVGAQAGASRTARLYGWADCVVRNDAAGTQALLGSTIGSPGEAAAIAGLQAYMNACMPAGSDLAVRRSELRSLVAQSAYFSMYRYWSGQLENARARSD